LKGTLAPPLTLPCVPLPWVRLSGRPLPLTAFW